MYYEYQLFSKTHYFCAAEPQVLSDSGSITSPHLWIQFSLQNIIFLLSYHRGWQELPNSLLTEFAGKNINRIRTEVY